MGLRSYSELKSIPDFAGRYEYLVLSGRVGEATFGSERYRNQEFYSSMRWKRARRAVNIRDNGCDLGIEGYDIHSGLYIHHMNPLGVEDLLYEDDSVLDPEFLITTSHRTHNAIHYGDKRQLPRSFVERSPNDHVPWLRKER